jgi:hypothetical protein
VEFPVILSAETSLITLLKYGEKKGKSSARKRKRKRRRDGIFIIITLNILEPIPQS